MSGQEAGKGHSNLWQRIMTGVPLGAGALALVWLGGIWFTLLVALAVWFALSEAGTFLRLRGIEPQWYTAAVSSLALVGAAHFLSYPQINVLLLASVVTVCIGEVVRFSKTCRPLSGAAGSIFMIVYCGWIPAHAVLLRRLQTADTVGLQTVRWSDLGLVLVGLMLLACIATDVGAYAFGKMLGRHKLCPQVSPGKTVEGSLGGIVTALALAWGWSVWSGLPMTDSLVLAGVGAVIAEWGDLFESAVKRDVGVKDSSHLLAGHGGALDRLDSFLLLVPFFYIYVFFFMMRSVH